MARYQVQGPDGQIHVFEGPDGATPDQVLAVARQMFAQPPHVDKETAAFMQSVNPVNGMNAFERGAAAAGKALTDIGRGAGQLVGLVSRDDVAQSRAMDAPLMATTAGKVGNFVGAAIPAAATALIPYANTITGGAAIGAGLGLLQPSTSTGETVQNVVTGGVAGGAVPALVKGVQIAKAAAEPFYDKGQQAIVGRALNRAAGQDAPAVAQRLQTAQELVPGSAPTVGQAAGSPGVAALERAATAANPDVTNAVSQRMAAQNAARVGVLDRLAGTDAQRTAAEGARETASQGLYQTATRATYTVDDTLRSLLQRPAVRQAMDRARVMAANDGRPFTFEVQSRTGLGSLGNQAEQTTNQITGQGLQDLKMALDDMLSDPASGFAGKAGRQVADLRGQLVNWMERANPDFQAARTTYRTLSQPLNEMDVAQALRDRAVSPLNGNLQPAAYARALADEGLPARATGFPAATYGNSVSPTSQNALQMLLADVQRANAAQNVGRGVGSDTVQKLAYSNMLDQSGVPSLLRNLSVSQVAGNLASRVADTAYGRANRELSNRLAQVMLDPQEAATLMFTATPRPPNPLLQALQRAGSALALTAPAAANAQKQQ